VNTTPSPPPNPSALALSRGMLGSWGLGLSPRHVCATSGREIHRSMGVDRPWAITQVALPS